MCHLASSTPGRGVYVVDKDGIIQDAQLVPEVATEPDYAPALATLKQLAG